MAALVAVVAAVLVPTGAVAAPPSPPPVEVLLTNVGNVNPHCAGEAFKLCLTPVEQRVAAAIAELDPDVIGFVEVLPPERCGALSPVNPNHVCATPQTVPQVARLTTHDDYTIVCGERFAWDCLALRSSVGEVEGCDGGYCGPVARTIEAVEGCDAGFQSLVVDTVLHGVPSIVVVSHPHSSDAACRGEELTRLFAAIPDDGRPVLLLGDFNLDPYRDAPDPSIEAWEANVGEGRRYGYRSGIAEADPPPGTIFPFESAQLDPTGTLPSVPSQPESAGRTIDHVLGTDDVVGPCATLGPTPGTTRIDGAQGGLDHRAIRCSLTVGASGPPPAPAPDPPVGPQLPVPVVVDVDGEVEDDAPPPGTDDDGAAADDPTFAPARGTLPVTGPTLPVGALALGLLLVAGLGSRRR